MTLEDKVGQLVQYSAGFATGPTPANSAIYELAAQGMLGSVLNVTGA